MVYSDPHHPGITANSKWNLCKSTNRVATVMKQNGKRKSFLVPSVSQNERQREGSMFCECWTLLSHQLCLGGRDLASFAWLQRCKQMGQDIQGATPLGCLAPGAQGIFSSLGSEERSVSLYLINAMVSGEPKPINPPVRVGPGLLAMCWQSHLPWFSLWMALGTLRPS